MRFHRPLHLTLLGLTFHTAHSTFRELGAVGVAEIMRSFGREMFLKVEP